MPCDNGCVWSVVNMEECGEVKNTHGTFAMRQSGFMMQRILRVIGRGCVVCESYQCVYIIGQAKEEETTRTQ